MSLTTHATSDRESTPTPHLITHFIRYDAPGSTRPHDSRRAECGQLIANRDHDVEPTCPECRRVRDDYEAMEF